jgi:ribonuclease P protein component
VALKRAFRLRKNRDFQRVSKRGRRVSSPLLTLSWTPNTEAQLRVGFVISKRVSRHAVDRNRLKRLLGEAIRPSLSLLAPGWDLVLYTRRETLSADLRALQSDIPELLRRARLLARSSEKHA